MALSSASSLGDWRLLFIQRDRVAAVTASDVNRVAKTYFQQPNRTLGVYIPAKEAQRLAVPAAPAIESVVTGYAGGAVAVAGEAFDPSPANPLDSRLAVIAKGGLKLGLLPKKNRGETVTLTLTLHYGNAESLKGHTVAAGMLPGLMMAGTLKHDRQALREELDALGIRLGTGGGGGRGGRRGGGGGGGGSPGQLTFSMQAKRDTLPQALKLLTEILREPAFPADEFETSKRRMISALSASRSEPAALAGNKVSRALSPYAIDDVRYVPTPEESLERVNNVTLAEIKTLYETQIDGSRAELGVIGDFDKETTLRLVEEMLAGWESKVPYRRIDRKVASNVSGLQDEIVTPDKSNAEYLAALAFPVSDYDPDYPALVIGNFIYGGSTLASRLGDRIRQKDGLSYGASSSFSASSRDPVASFTVTVSTNPQNIDKVTLAVTEELERFLKDGPTEKELHDAQQAFVESQKVGRTGDAAIAGQIAAANLETGRTFAFAARSGEGNSGSSPPVKVAGRLSKVRPSEEAGRSPRGGL